MNNNASNGPGGEQQSNRSDFLGKSAQAVSKFNNAYNGFNDAKKFAQKNKERVEKFKANRAAKQNKANGADKKSPQSDSVKKKKEETKKKQDNSKSNLDKAKDKGRQGLEDGKRKANELAFKKSASTLADVALPGSGQLAENLLDSPLGEKPMEAARNSSNAVSAVKNGFKELMALVKNITQKVNLISSLLPTLVTLMVVVVVVLGILSKFTDSQNYLGKGNSEETEMDPKYEKFYENLEKYGGTNKAMVLAVLTAYKDNDGYTNNDDLTGEAESCTEEEISSGDCIVEVEDGIQKYSKSKMKKYIKKVAKAISDSGGNIEEGDYDDPANTGSPFFQWLYAEFVEDYYSEFLDNAGENLDKKKQEIVHFIYLYYESLEHENCVPGSSGFQSACDFNLTTVNVLACDGETIMKTLSLKEYLLGVTLAEIDTWGDEEHAFKAFVIVAKTYSLNRDAYNSETKKISLRSCTKDQVWCDIDNGCNKRKYDGFDETYSKAYTGISGGEDYKAPLSAERKEKWSKWYDEVAQYLYLDLNKYNGPITTLSGNPIGYYDDQQEYWYEQAHNNNKTFDQVFAGTDAATGGSEYFHFDSLAGENLGLYDLGNYCSKISGGTAVAGEYVYYGQYEQPWASELHGCDCGPTFQAKGCFQTSMAMIATNLLGREITPSETNALTRNNKSNSCSFSGGYCGSYASFFDVAAKNYGLVRDTFQNKQSNSAQKMKEELAKGNLIIQLLTCDHVSPICPTAFGGHAIVIVPGSKEGYVTVLDPGRSQKTWEVTLEEAVGNNTQGWFSSFSINTGTVQSGEIDSSNSHLVTTGGLSNACTYTPNNSSGGNLKYSETIYVGDSRTVGMCGAKGFTDDNCIAEIGMGYNWLKTTAIIKLDSKLKNNPKVNVIIGLGGNDLGNINNYISYYAQLVDKYPDTNFIITSVNHVDEEKEKEYGYSLTNSGIDEFNKNLKSGLTTKATYCDINAKLGNDFVTTDGIHYDEATSLKFYNYMQEC